MLDKFIAIKIKYVRTFNPQKKFFVLVMINKISHIIYGIVENLDHRLFIKYIQLYFFKFKDPSTMEIIRLYEGEVRVLSKLGVILGISEIIYFYFLLLNALLPANQRRV